MVTLSDSKILFDNDKTLEIWDLDKEIKEDFINTGIFSTTLKLLDQDRVAFGITDLHIWNLKTKKQEMFLKTKRGSQIKDIKLLPNGRLVVVHYYSMEVYDLPSRKILFSYDNDKKYFTETFFLDDERLIVAQKNYVIRILSLLKKEVIKECYFPVEHINHIEMLPGNEVLFASRFGIIGVWDLSTYIFRSNFETHSTFWHLELTQDKVVVASLPDGEFKVLT